MKMKHGLPSPGAGVHHQAIAVREAFLLRYLLGHEEELTHKLRVILLKLVYTLDVPIRDYEHVSRRLRVPIVERGHVIIPMDDARRGISLSNATEHAIAHMTTSPFTVLFSNATRRAGVIWLVRSPSYAAATRT